MTELIESSIILIQSRNELTQTKRRKEKENMAEEKAKILEGLQDPIEEKATETIIPVM